MKEEIEVRHPVFDLVPVSVSRIVSPEDEKNLFKMGEVGGLSLIKGGPEPELGKQFIDWCFTKKAQELFQQYNRLPVNPEAEVAEGSVTLDQVKLIDYDHVWAGQNKDDMIKAWRDRIGK